jgi:hypothetical protein
MLALAVGGGTVVAAGVPPAGAKPLDGADQVRTWNAITVSTLVAAPVPVPEQPLYLTYVQKAVYNAVRHAASRRGTSIPAAVVAAAHDVLVGDFPDQQSTLDADYDASLVDLPDDRARRAGLRIGSRAAHRLLVARADDGRNAPPLPAPSPGVGVWQPVPPNTVGVSSWLGNVRPFAIRSGSQFRPGPPPALSSARWVRDYNETRLYGSATSSTRTPEQTEVARFWSEPPYVQNQDALRDYTTRSGWDVLHTARLFAMADEAAADGLIACFDAKYHYEFWRPVTAIPAGDTDGNPATPGDPSWTPLLATPNFPEYPSAHGCATGALATVVAALTSHDGAHLDLDLHSALTGTTHHFSTLSQLLTEVANARVWGGLHWRFSTTVGVQIGQAVARVVLREQRCGRRTHH